MQWLGAVLFFMKKTVTCHMFVNYNVHVCINVKVRKKCRKSTGNMTYEFTLKGFDCAVLIWPVSMRYIKRFEVEFTFSASHCLLGKVKNRGGGSFIGRAVLLETIR